MIGYDDQGRELHPRWSTAVFLMTPGIVYTGPGGSFVGVVLMALAGIAFVASITRNGGEPT